MTSKDCMRAVLAVLLAVGIAACDSPEPTKAPVVQEVTERPREAFGDYVVHYSAHSTAMLNDDVARAEGIEQGAGSAMLIVAVLRQNEGSANESVAARVEAQTVNLVGQMANVSMTERRDGASISYIGEFTVANRETVNFNITVQPEGSETAHEFSFQQDFHNQLK